MPEPGILAVADVSVDVGDGFRLHDLGLEATPGEHLGILGPNGAGKTTLIRLLSGELTPDSGSIRVGAEDIATISPDRLATLRAVLGADAGRKLPFTVRSVVEMGRYPYRRDHNVSSDDDMRAVESAMVRADVAQIADRTHATLSTGERARVSFARVLAQDTPILLLDEPAASLDVGHTESILGQARRAAEAGGTVVSVIHDLNAAAFHCTSLLLLHHGQVMATGVPENVLSEDLLSEVYGTRLRVVPHPYRDCPLVLVEGPQRAAETTI